MKGKKKKMKGGSKLPPLVLQATLNFEPGSPSTPGLRPISILVEELKGTGTLSTHGCWFEFIVTII